MSNRIHCFIFAALLACCSMFAHAQTVSPFMAMGNAQFFDNNGQVLTAGVLYSYQAGTTTQQATFTDSTGLIQNPNPIPFGSGARVSIWLTSAAFYKFVLCLQNDGAFCAPADVLFSVDQVPGCAGCSTAGNTFTGTFITSSTNPATTGVLRLATSDAICWRNQANTANLCIAKNTSDSLTWPSNIVIPGFLQGSSYISTCANPASGGAVRLCKTDQLNWRNNANTADQGLSQDGSDRGLWSYAGGLETVGAIADIFLGGTSASFPRIVQNGAAINFKLGDLSANADITAGAVTVQAVKIHGVAANNNVLAANSSTDATWQAPAMGGVNQFVAVSPGCTAAGAPCTVTGTWPNAFADTSYFVFCQATSEASNSVAAFWVSTKNTGTFVISIDNRGTSNPGGFNSFDCWGHHN